MRGVVTRGLHVCAAVLIIVVGVLGVGSQRLVADDAGLIGGSMPRARAHNPQSTAKRRASSPYSKREEQKLFAQAKHVDAHWVAEDDAGRRVEFGIAPGLQERAQRILSEYQVPHAAVVAIEPSTGRVLAYVNHSSTEAHAPDFARDVSAPAASVFKLITSSALIEAGVGPGTRVCYSGGSSRIDLIHLQDDPRRDRACTTLDDALGKSTNAVFAKLADRHLKPATLQRFARAFGFGSELPFNMAPPASPIDVPSARLEFARTAAGFWHSYMSPFHAALIAATFANDGAMPEPWLVQRVVSNDGAVRDLSRAGSSRRVIEPATARSVAHMMLRTVKDGTSRNAFSDGRGRPALPGIAVAGKTGSLSASDPYRAYSWWAGFAPAERPRIALAVLIVNEPKWRIKSSFVARELLREYLATQHATTSEIAQSKL